jgi:hypothetical protein
MKTRHQRHVAALRRHRKLARRRARDLRDVMPIIEAAISWSDRYNMGEYMLRATGLDRIRSDYTPRRP